MNKRQSLSVLALALLSSITPAVADDASWDVAANLDLQSRLFTQDAGWAGQEPDAMQLSLAATAEFRWRNAARSQRAAIVTYARWDQVDTERSLLDLREAYWALRGDTFELLLGANTVFWGVTESVHLVDIINQADAVADIDGEDKLGQPMLNLAVQRDWGLLSLYVLPYFRERSFAGVEGRLRTPLPVAAGAPVYESAAEQRHVDFALRYSHNIGDVDIGLSVFDGTSREPRLLPDATGDALQPYYDQIEQAGVDLQYTRDAWLWKLEAIARNGYAETFAAAVAGFEYSFYQVAASNADLGVLLEYQYDARGAQEPATIADNDVFVACRLALNDMQDTAVLAGLGYDLDTGETFFNVEAERRIGQSYVLELRARVFAGASPQDITYALASDDYLQLQLSRFF
jgi:hypothetical protein